MNRLILEFEDNNPHGDPEEIQQKLEGSRAVAEADRVTIETSDGTLVLKDRSKEPT
jgi:hypothetical protein